MSFASNISSLKAQRQLSVASEKISNISTRLSTGQRINKASDDAAGLALSGSLKARKIISERSVKNLGDGISILNVADGALEQMSSILTRLQELAQQGANGSYSRSQRDALQGEASALQSEFNRIIRSTNFNGNSVLTGESARVVLQAGFGTEGTLTMQIGAAVTSDAFGEYSAGSTALASSNNSGVAASAAVNALSVTRDGRYIAFLSTASNLVSGTTAGRRHMYIKDLETGEIKLGSSSSDGTEASANATGAQISRDGRYATFISTASNLTGVSTNQVYLKDLQTGKVTLVSTDANGTPLASGATVSGGGLSADNRYLSFTTTATNLVSGVTGTNEQQYRKDLWTGAVMLISSSTSGVQQNGDITLSGSSPDGNLTVFISTATNLVDGQTLSPNQAYVKDATTGRITVVSSSSSGVAGTGAVTSIQGDASGRFYTFSYSGTDLISGVTTPQVYRKDILSGQLTLVSTARDGSQANGSSTQSLQSADGRYIAFRSDATNLIPGYSIPAGQIYRKDLETGEISLVSRSTSGDIATSTPSTVVIRMSDDGRKVLFQSAAANIDPRANNGFQQLFVRDMSTAGVQQLAGVIVSDQGSSRITLQRVSTFFNEISDARAGVGVSLSRVGVALSQANSYSTTLAETLSQFIDSDVPSDMAQLVSSQILQNAAVAVLTQANQQPALALSLLRTNLR